MEGDTKRKWRWSSKSAIASSRPSKVVVVDRSVLDTHDGAADRVGVTEISLDGCSMEDGHERSGMAARMRRHGSRFLSIVGLQRSTGMFFFFGSAFPLVELPTTNCDQNSGIPSIRQILQASEMLRWLSLRKL